MVGCIERDPAMRYGPADLGDAGVSTGARRIFTCSTQLVPYQRVQFFGTKGRIEIEIPFNAPKDRPTRIFIDGGRSVWRGHRHGGVPGLRPVHAAGRCVLKGDSGGRRSAGAARRGHPEHEGDRGDVPVGGDGAVGERWPDGPQNGVEQPSGRAKASQCCMV